MIKKLFVFFLLIVFTLTTSIGYKKYSLLLTETSKVAAQLNDTFNSKLEYDRNNNFGVKTSDIEAFPGGLVTFVDDDGFDSVWNKLRPIFEEKKVPCVTAVPTDTINTPEHLSSDNLLYLQKIGWEVASHSASHAHLADLEPYKIEKELKDSKEALDKLNIKCNYIVYPYGSVNSTVTNLTEKYFDAGIDITVGFNKVPLNKYLINRIPLGSYFAPEDGSDTLEYYKSKIDNAKKTSSWLIFMMHVNETDDTQLSYISQVIDYCKQNNIKITNLTDGFKMADDFTK